MNFTLNWFKSQRAKELEELQIKEQKLKNKLLKKNLKKDEKTDELIKDWQKQPLIFLPDKPYTTVKLVNDVLTIVLCDGTIIVKPNATQEDFINVRKCSSEEDIFLITSGKEIVEDRKKEKKEYDKAVALKDGINKLSQFEDFIVKGDSVYMTDVPDRSLPQLLIERFLELTNGYSSLEAIDEYISLKKFWLKCCLNPNAQSAEDLYTFLSHHQFKIDKHGNFYAYRRVVSRETANKELVDFIGNAYNKVKAIWKKNPEHYMVYSRLGEYQLISQDKQPTGDNPYWEIVGNLKLLYIDLPNMKENSYTDKHTHTFDYRVGSVSSMPRNSGDDNNQISCSKGFHQASKEYDYSGFGDTPILTIINPIDVLAVPLNEVGKLRTCRWFFAMTLPEDEQFILDDEDFDVTELGDIFEEKCNENLENYVHNSFTEEVKRHTFTIPQISDKQITNIVKSLEEMNNEIKGRIKII